MLDGYYRNARRELGADDGTGLSLLALPTIKLPEGLRNALEKALGKPLRLI